MSFVYSVIAIKYVMLFTPATNVIYILFASILFSGYGFLYVVILLLRADQWYRGIFRVNGRSRKRRTATLGTRLQSVDSVIRKRLFHWKLRTIEPDVIATRATYNMTSGKTVIKRPENESAVGTRRRFQGYQHQLSSRNLLLIVVFGSPGC